MPDKLSVLEASFPLLFFFAGFCPIGKDIGDDVSYSLTSMGVFVLEDDE